MEQRVCCSHSVWHFFECVSFSLSRFFLSVSSIPSGHWQVKISRDSALQSSKPSFCRVHPWRRLKLRLLCPRLCPRSCFLAAIVDFVVRPVTAAPLVCASLLVETHRAPARLSRRHLNFTPDLALSCCRLRLRAASPCAPGSQRLVCYSYGFFSALPASSMLAVTMAFRARTPSSIRSTPTTRWACTTWPSLAVTAHLPLSCRHTLSGPVSSPRCASLSISSTVCYPHPSIDCFALLSHAFSFVRDGSLLTSRTSSNSQAWIPTQQYGRSTYRLCPLGFSDTRCRWATPQRRAPQYLSTSVTYVARDSSLETMSPD